MNTTNNNLRLPWLSLALLLLLMALAPYAMSFPPYVVDSLHFRRVALVLLGLATAVTAFVEFVATLRRPRTDIVTLATFAAVFLACAVVGWRSYPYWATGVYQVCIGTFPWTDQDPKGLIPMVWIGDFWRMPVLLLHWLVPVAVPPLAAAVIVALWRHRFMAGLVTSLCIGISLLFMRDFSPHYITWLLD